MASAPQGGHQTFRTTGRCGEAVRAAVQEVSGVTDVAVTLVAGGTSTLIVVRNRPLTEQIVAAALEEAGGYRLAIG